MSDILELAKALGKFASPSYIADLERATKNHDEAAAKARGERLQLASAQQKEAELKKREEEIATGEAGLKARLSEHEASVARLEADRRLLSGKEEEIAAREAAISTKERGIKEIEAKTLADSAEAEAIRSELQRRAALLAQPIG